MCVFVNKEISTGSSQASGNIRHTSRFLFIILVIMQNSENKESTLVLPGINRTTSHMGRLSMTACRNSGEWNPS